MRGVTARPRRVLSPPDPPHSGTPQGLGAAGWPCLSAPIHGAAPSPLAKESPGGKEPSPAPAWLRSTALRASGAPAGGRAAHHGPRFGLRLTPRIFLLAAPVAPTRGQPWRTRSGARHRGHAAARRRRRALLPSVTTATATSPARPPRHSYRHHHGSHQHRAVQYHQRQQLHGAAVGLTDFGPVVSDTYTPAHTYQAGPGSDTAGSCGVSSAVMVTIPQCWRPRGASIHESWRNFRRWWIQHHRAESVELFCRQRERAATCNDTRRLEINFGLKTEMPLKGPSGALMITGLCWLVG